MTAPKRARKRRGPRSGSSIRWAAKRGNSPRPSTALSDPVWSPDGKYIAYASRIGGTEDKEVDEAKEADASAAASEKKAKKSDVKVITDIRYKADGIHHLLVGRGYRHLFVTEVSNAASEPSEGRQLTFGDWDDAGAAWSPDGTQIAFCSNRTPDRDFNNFTDLWTVSTIAGQPHKLTQTLGPSSSPAWSPDGRQIAFLGHVNPEPYGRYANAGVWVVAADGSAAPQNLTETFDRSFAGDVAGDLRSGLVAQPPLWSNDGASIYATAIDRGAEHLFQLALAGGEPQRIIAGDRGVMNARLSRRWPDHLHHCDGHQSGRSLQLRPRRLR